MNDSLDEEREQSENHVRSFSFCARRPDSIPKQSISFCRNQSNRSAKQGRGEDGSASCLFSAVLFCLPIMQLCTRLPRGFFSLLNVRYRTATTADPPPPRHQPGPIQRPLRSALRARSPAFARTTHMHNDRFPSSPRHVSLTNPFSSRAPEEEVDRGTDHGRL